MSSGADAVIPFADEQENNNNEKTDTENTVPKTNITSTDEHPQSIVDSTNQRETSQSFVNTGQTTADIHQPKEPTLANETFSNQTVKNETDRDQTAKTEPDTTRDQVVNEPENEEISIEPTLTISELKVPIPESKFVQPAGRAPHTSVTAASAAAGEDVPDSLLDDGTHERSPLTTDREEDEGPITIQPKETKEKHLIPARKRKSTKKKRLLSFREWITCTRTERDIYEPVQTSVEKSSAESTPKVVKIDNVLDAFIHYNHKAQEPGRPHGRGLCVIFTLFTGELKGYYQDRGRAFKFFREKLDYDVYCDGTFVNCTQAQLKSNMRQIQRVIAKKKRYDGRPYYDRLAFIILTHGEKGGLMTCADPGGILEEKRQVFKDNRWVPERVLTKIEDIVAYFKHDVVPELKDKPKMFLIQACRGADVLRAAGGGADEVGELPQYDLSNLKLRPEVPIDADTLVLYATTPDHESWVSPTDGSWFIQKSLEVFERHYKSKHAEEMMTLINLIISEERGVTLHGDGSTSEVVQMPCKFSTLRMKFYL